MTSLSGTTLSVAEPYKVNLGCCNLNEPQDCAAAKQESWSCVTAEVALSQKSHCRKAEVLRYRKERRYCIYLSVCDGS
jgi:hypothetical protein